MSGNEIIRMLTEIGKKKWNSKYASPVKVCCYTARYSVRRTVQSALHKFHPLAELFIPSPARLLWEALSHYAITARRLFTHISTTVYSQVLIYTA